MIFGVSWCYISWIFKWHYVHLFSALSIFLSDLWSFWPFMLTWLKLTFGSWWTRVNTLFPRYLRSCENVEKTPRVEWCNYAHLNLRRNTLKQHVFPKIRCMSKYNSRLEANTEHWTLLSSHGKCGGMNWPAAWLWLVAMPWMHGILRASWIWRI